MFKTQQAVGDFFNRLSERSLQAVDVPREHGQPSSHYGTTSCTRGRARMTQRGVEKELPSSYQVLELAPSEG